MKRLLPILALVLIFAVAAIARAQQITANTVQTQTIVLPASDTIAQVSNVTVAPSVYGTTAYFYWIVSRTASAVSIPAGPFVGNAPASLSSVQNIAINWTPVSGITSYDLLRTSSSTAPSAACGCAVALATTLTTITDSGAALQAYTVSATGDKWSITNQQLGGVQSVTGTYQGTTYQLLPPLPASMTQDVTQVPEMQINGASHVTGNNFVWTKTPQTPGTFWRGPTIGGGSQIVQQVSGASNAASITLPYPSPNSTGNLLVAFATVDFSSPATWTISDTQGNTWTRWAVQAGGGSLSAAVWYDCNAKAGSNSVTTTSGSGTKSQMAIMEITGNLTSVCQDTLGSGAGAANPMSLLTGTPSQSNEIVLGFSSVSAANLLTQVFTSGVNPSQAGGYSTTQKIVSAMGAGETDSEVTVATQTSGYSGALDVSQSVYTLLGGTLQAPTSHAAFLVAFKLSTLTSGPGIPFFGPIGLNDLPNVASFVPGAPVSLDLAEWLTASGQLGDSGIAASKIPQLLFGNVTPVTVSNTTTETTLMSYTIPANTVTSTGQDLHIRAAGFNNNSSAGNVAYTYKLYIDSTVIATNGAEDPVTGDKNTWWTCDADALFTAVGSGGSTNADGTMVVEWNNNGISYPPTQGPQNHTVAFNTTATHTIKITVTLGTAATTIAPSEDRLFVSLD